MNQETKVIQKTGINSEATQIATQNNYYGLTPEEATKIAMDLFYENFPKLQEEARKVVEERAEAFCNTVIDKLTSNGHSDFSEFKDPDLQYVLNLAQNEFARFGTDELLQTLSDIIITRVQYNNHHQLKVLLDKTIEIASFLSVDNLNYLTTIFYCKHLKRYTVRSIDDLKGLLEEVCHYFPVIGNAEQYYQLISPFNLFILYLGQADEVLSKTYNIDRDSIKQIMPKQFYKIHADYGLSPLGKILAIINNNSKSNNKIDLYRFLHLE